MEYIQRPYPLPKFVYGHTHSKEYHFGIGESGYLFVLFPYRITIAQKGDDFTLSLLDMYKLEKGTLKVSLNHGILSQGEFTHKFALYFQWLLSYNKELLTDFFRDPEYKTLYLNWCKSKKLNRQLAEFNAKALANGECSYTYTYSVKKHGKKEVYTPYLRSILSPASTARIPPWITNIPSSFFADTSISTVVFHPNVEHIGLSSFKGCKNLREITLPENCKSVEVSAFAHCPNLKVVHINPKLQTISSAAFTAVDDQEDKARTLEVHIPKNHQNYPDMLKQIQAQWKNVKIYVEGITPHYNLKEI